MRGGIPSRRSPVGDPALAPADQVAVQVSRDLESVGRIVLGTKLSESFTATAGPGSTSAPGRGVIAGNGVPTTQYTLNDGLPAIWDPALWLRQVLDHLAPQASPAVRRPWPWR
jgi:hypothetical protein